MAVAEKLAAVRAEMNRFISMSGQYARTERALAQRQRVAAATLADILPMARGMLARNLAGSGIKNRTHKLAGAVAQSTLAFRKDAIVALMPPDVEDYESKTKTGKKKPSIFYRVAESLNSGAVRQPLATRPVRDPVSGSVTGHNRRGLLGASAARTLKRNALGLPTSARANSSLRGGINGEKIKRRGIKFGLGNKVERTRSVVFAGGTGKGGMVVIRPRPFYHFTESQQGALLSAFFDAFNARLAREAR